MSFTPSAASVCPCMGCSGQYGVGRFELAVPSREYGDADPAHSDTGISQNGWPAARDSKAIGVASFSVPLKGGAKSVQLVPGAAAALVSMITWWDQNIEPVTTLGGYNYRDIRGSTTTLSNHSSGTAVDINAAKHPLGAHGTVSAADAVRIAAKAASLGLVWGGTWMRRPDAMHFEMAKGGKVATITKAAGTTIVPLLALIGGFWYARRQGWV